MSLDMRAQNKKMMRKRLLRIFDSLLAAFGKRNWWPGEHDFEMVVGAVLTQSTSWKNVEKAIQNLKQNDALDIRSIYTMEQDRLAELIRSSGFYNIKANRLKNIVNVLHDIFDANIANLQDIDTYDMREIFLGISGIGRETADSIILYALNKPIFVIDAYTKRFLENHGLYHGRDDYDDVQRFFMENLPHDTYLFNEFHALIVCLGQRFCKRPPVCQGCPLAYEL